MGGELRTLPLWEFRVLGQDFIPCLFAFIDLRLREGGARNLELLKDTLSICSCFRFNFVGLRFRVEA